MLYNVKMKGLPLSSHIFIWTYPVFYCEKFPSAALIYLFVSANEPGKKYEIYGVMWQVESESKIRFASCELSPKYLLGLYALEDIGAIGTYIFCVSLWSVLFSSLFVDV